MKRYNNLFDKIVTLDNLYLADKRARKQKQHRPEIINFDNNREKLLLDLQKKLINGEYKTSEYYIFKIYEPKEREIFKLPYYPDRIVHHAIMNIMEPIWVSSFIKGTYSCIKNRGIHKALKDVKFALKDEANTKYCLKLDVRKFYPSIDHDILKQLIRRKVKDKKLLIILDEIIDSAQGVPIGNYLSQFFANLYLTYLDHWIKEEKHIKYYFRYADDIVVLSDNKEFLRTVLLSMKLYLRNVLKLELKQNYQIFPVNSRGIDFVGYKFFHTHVLLRKSIKVRLFKLIKGYKDKKIDRNELRRRMQSYFGWLKFCNSKNLLHKIQLETGLRFSNWNGKKVNISRFYGKYIHIVDIILYSNRFRVNFVYNYKSYYFESKNKRLLYSIRRYSLPVNFKITPYVRPKKNRSKPATRTD